MKLKAFLSNFEDRDDVRLRRSTTGKSRMDGPRVTLYVIGVSGERRATHARWTGVRSKPSEVRAECLRILFGRPDAFWLIQSLDYARWASRWSSKNEEPRGARHLRQMSEYRTNCRSPQETQVRIMANASCRSAEIFGREL
jgi:hypothetical protein